MGVKTDHNCLVPKAAVAVVLRNLIHRMTRGVVKKINKDDRDVYTKS